MFVDAPTRDWPLTLADAQSDVAGGNFGTADSVLAGFAVRYPGTLETLESTYWRALYRLDPANRAESTTVAMASLDAYLHDPRPREHVAEASTLRRVAGQIDALTRLAAMSAQSKDSVIAKSAASEVHVEGARNTGEAQAASDAEIKRLKDELAKANAELDRIKRRLSQPPSTAAPRP